MRKRPADLEPETPIPLRLQSPRSFLAWLLEQPQGRLYTTRKFDTPLHHWVRAVFPDKFSHLGSLQMELDGVLYPTPVWMSRLLIAFTTRSLPAREAWKMAKRVLDVDPTR